MGFSLDVVGDGKKNITEIIHIKYVENMDLKSKTDGLKISRKIRMFKKNGTENELQM
jgi:hypothetical protein